MSFVCSGLGSLAKGSGAGQSLYNSKGSPSPGQVVKSQSTEITPYYPPNEGFMGEPTSTTLNPGTMIQRTGGLGGTYIAPSGTPSQMLSLPYYQIGKETSHFVVEKSFDVLAGKVAPWFGQIGGGTQYIAQRSVEDLLNGGFISRIS